MDRTNNAFKELVSHVSQESNALYRESLNSMENMNTTIGAQSANSVATVAREFGNLVLVDHNSKVPFVPEVGAVTGNAIASVAAMTALIASTQEKESKQEESMKTHSNSGINDLIAVTQMKNSNANDQALSQAVAYQGEFTTVAGDERTVWDAEYVGPITEGYSDKYSESNAEASPYSQSWSDLGNASENFEIPVAVRKARMGSSFNWDRTDNYTKVNRMKPITAEWRIVKDDDNDDKLGNFSIQNMMSDYNQAEALASSVAKKSDDTKSSVLGKI